MKDRVKTRIRSSGECAATVRTYLTDRIREVEIVGEQEPAKLMMMNLEDFDEALEDAAAAAAYARTRDG